MAQARAKRVGSARRLAADPEPRKLKAVDETDHAHLSDVRDFAAGLPEKYLHCRELGHLWRPFTAGRHPDGGFTRTLRCTRCKTRREQELSSTGMVLTNQYKHPDGYLTEGMGRIVGEGRGLLRLESIMRVLPTEDDQVVDEED